MGGRARLISSRQREATTISGDKSLSLSLLIAHHPGSTARHGCCMSDVTSDIRNDVLVASGAHAQAAQRSARRGHRAHRSCRRLTAVTCGSYVHGYASFRAGARSPLPPHHMRPSLSSIKYEYYYTRLAFRARAVTRGGLAGAPLDVILGSRARRGRRARPAAIAATGGARPFPRHSRHKPAEVTSSESAAAARRVAERPVARSPKRP